MEAKEFLDKLRKLRGETPEQPPAAAASAAPIAASAAPVAPTAPAAPLPEAASDEVTRRTATMWKYRPVDGASLEPYPEYVSRLLRLPGGDLFGARVRGKKHKHDGTNCDDWFAWEALDDWTVLAVADGAGSKKFSRIGARTSCEAAVAYIKLQLTALRRERDALSAALALPRGETAFSKACLRLASAVQQGVMAAKEAVGQALVERCGDPRYAALTGRPLRLNDFAATLLVALLVPVTVEGRREHVMVSCQIGDGMLAAVREDAPFGEALCLLGKADGGRYAGETEFLTSRRIATMEDLMARTTVTRREISAVLAMTDGVADDYYPNAPQLLRLYLDLQLNGILGSLAFHTLLDLAANLPLLKKLPEPESYPWVNDPSEAFPVQSARRVLADTGLRLEELWNNRDVLHAAFLHTFGAENKGGWPQEKMLEIWLDNYVERGSFDDRTLVVFRRRRG